MTQFKWSFLCAGENNTLNLKFYTQQMHLSETQGRVTASGADRRQSLKDILSHLLPARGIRQPVCKTYKT